MDSLADLMLDGPPVDCIERDEVLGQVTRALFSVATPPRRLGRYRVLERLGGGGQGVVYAGEDPELGRRVAIKLLRVATGSEAAHRLRQEATALAQLSHPNVIAINDVGSCELGMFLVMQLVPGRTLSSWLTESRSWRAILAAFDGAARGLAAAHERGIVHRDFKPSNVWMGDDGVVRLLDFGIAQLGAGRDGTPTPVSSEQSCDRLTAVGRVLGTPAYMAPEQHDGEPVTPVTDQYAYCVTLFEALYGARPFAGSSMEALLAAKQAGVVPEPPRGCAVPIRVHRVLARGLHPDPTRRWPSMAALCVALAGATRSRAPRALLCAGVLGVALGAASWWGERAPASGCHDAPELAQLWSSARREELAAALGHSGLPVATDMAARVPAQVDAFAARWSAARADACGAVETDPTADLRLRCLDRLLVDLDDRLGILQRASLDVVVHADQLVRDLQDPASCAASVEPSPEAEELRRALAHARALGVAGHMAAATEAAHRAVASAETLDEGLRAEAGAVYGELLLDGAEIEPAIDVLEDAYLRAMSVGHDRVAFEAALRLSNVFAATRQDPPRCGEWVQRAAAAMSRSTDAGDPVARGRLALARAKHGFSAGEYAQAVEHAREAADQLEAANDFRVTGALTTLAQLSSNLGRHDEALGVAYRSVEVAERLRGADHPATASALQTLATMKGSRGDTEGALTLLARVLEIRRNIHGDDDLQVAEARRNIATTHARAGHDTQAIAGYREVLAIQRRHLPVDDSKIAQTLYNLSLPLRDLGEIDEATALGREAVRIAEASIGADHPTTAIYLHGLGETLARTDPRAALELFEQGIAIVRRAVGERHPLFATFTASIGGCKRELGDLSGARAMLETSLAIFDADEGRSDAIAHSRTLHELGLVRAALGDTREALADHQRSLDIMQAARGSEHASLVEILQAIAQRHDRLGHTAEAARARARAKAIARATSGPP